VSVYRLTEWTHHFSFLRRFLCLHEVWDWQSKLVLITDGGS